ncbi:MAG: hypothetical protein RTU30_01080 [Candidatus Thorarchaeota archaeon]
MTHILGEYDKIKSRIEGLISNRRATELFGNGLNLLFDELLSARRNSSLVPFDRYIRGVEAHIQQMSDPELRMVIKSLEETSLQIWPSLVDSNTPLVALNENDFSISVENESKAHYIRSMNTTVVEVPYLIKRRFIDCYMLPHEIGHLSLINRLGWIDEGSFRNRSDTEFILSLLSNSDLENSEVKTAHRWVREFSADIFSVMKTGPVIPAIYSYQFNPKYWMNGLDTHPPTLVRIITMYDIARNAIDKKSSFSSLLSNVEGILRNCFNIDTNSSWDKQIREIATKLDSGLGSKFSKEIMLDSRILIELIRHSESIIAALGETYNDIHLKGNRKYNDQFPYAAEDFVRKLESNLVNDLGWSEFRRWKTGSLGRKTRNR